MTETGSSSYSSGGGGVTLEHNYAATLLIHLLTGDPLHELGDRLTVDRIRLQASDVSAVDDIVIEGHDGSGETHRTSIGVRRSPALTTSDDPSVPLFGDYIRVVTENWPDVSSGLWSLNLAVATHRSAYTQTNKLSGIANSTPDTATFLSQVNRPGAVNSGDRVRLQHLTELVKRASAGTSLNQDELLWRVLANLKIRILRLEGTDLSDRTQAVAALRRVVADQSAETANDVFARISELARQWASTGAVINEAMLRRALRAHPLKRSATHNPAWRVMDGYAARLRQAVRPGLGSGSETLLFERSAERGALADELRRAGASCGALIVTGEPDVGKSALSLRVLEELREAGATTISLSLAELPDDIATFETVLGDRSMTEVLSTAETHTTQIMLVDGTESTLAGKSSVFRYLVTSALAAGIGVAAVTRTDGRYQVRQDLQYALEATTSPEGVAEYTVDSLDEADRERLSSTFGTLKRLRGDPRADWLLGRPGLVNALLRTNITINPSDVLCEADVYATVWNGVIRHNETRTTGESSPDDRDCTAVNAAHRLLGSCNEPSLGSAVAELRSSGVFRAPANPAFSTGIEFASDLFRDYALCRLFLTRGWDVLAEAGAPRWSIRAVRLACQVLLDGSYRDIVWMQLTSFFDSLAEREGARWSEVPYEALLSLGQADEALEQLWVKLSANDGRGTEMLFRLARSHYVKETIGDRFALQPLVDIAYCRPPTPDPVASSRTPNGLKKLVLAWLRGMAISDFKPHPVRQRIRDKILPSESTHPNEFAVEAVALLGPDLDERAKSWLLAVADGDPINLWSAVESACATIALAHNDPQLLLKLTEKYYLEDPDGSRGRNRGGANDYGIRDWRHGPGVGFDQPPAAWHYGPFWQLLRLIPADAVAFINRMLDHAAANRVQSDIGDEIDTLAGIDLIMAGSPSRRYVGDNHVWAWYRGSGVGPSACMSALFALERFMDSLYEELELSLKQVAHFAIRDSHNMATLGLVMGFLTRHLESVVNELDPFLVNPDVWTLESSRVTSDLSFGVRDEDAKKLTGNWRRGNTPHFSVMEMVHRAQTTGDEARTAELVQLGAELLVNARLRAGGSFECPEDAAMYEGWAARFRPESYEALTTEHGWVLDFTPPAHVSELLAPRNAESDITSQLLGFRNRYAHPHDDPAKWSMSDLEKDIPEARRLHQGGTPLGSLWPEDSLAAVASAAIRAHALGLAAISEPDLEWSIDIVLTGAEEPRVDEFSYHKTYFAQAADRAAALAIPLLSLPAFDDLAIDQNRVQRAHDALASSLFDEVRAAYSDGCVHVWPELCDIDDASHVCIRHTNAWSAALASLADSQSDHMDYQTQERIHRPVARPFTETLWQIADDELLVNRLRMPAVCMSDARAVPCLAREVDAIWVPLWDAHRRALYSWSSLGYDHNEIRNTRPLALRLLRTAQSGESEPLDGHLQTSATNPHSLHHLMESLMHSITYDDDIRHPLHDLWPHIMSTVLDTIRDGSVLGGRTGTWYDYAIASVLPIPKVDPYEPDFDATMARCRQSWVTPKALAGLDERWLVLARGLPGAADAVVQFARTTPQSWQRSTALSWVESIVGDRFDLFANRLSYAGEWLANNFPIAEMDGVALSRYRRIIDGLAGAGDRDAVALQQREE